MSNYVTHTPSQSAAKQAVEELVLNPKDQLLVLSGSDGTGKTHLLCAGLVMADEGRYVTARDISEQIDRSHSAGEDKTEAEIIEELAATPLLAMDDSIPTQDELKAEYKSDYFWLIYLLTERHARSKPTILATNRHFMSACSASNPYECDTCLEGILDKSVTSKISRAITLDGLDHRQEKLSA